MKKIIVVFLIIIIAALLGYKYWQTSPSYSLLQIQKSIKTKDSELFYKHVDIENLLEEFYKDSYSLLEEYFSSIFNTGINSEFFAAEMKAENAFIYFKPLIESSIKEGLGGIWGESKNESSEIFSSEDYKFVEETLSNVKLAYINKKGDKAYLGLLMTQLVTKEEFIYEFELIKIKDYWQVKKFSNFKASGKELIIELIEYFNSLNSNPEDLSDEESKKLE